MHKFPLLSAILSDPEPMFGLQPTRDYWLDIYFTVYGGK